MKGEEGEKGVHRDRGDSLDGNHHLEARLEPDLMNPPFRSTCRYIIYIYQFDPVDGRLKISVKNN